MCKCVFWCVNTCIFTSLSPPYNKPSNLSLVVWSMCVSGRRCLPTLTNRFFLSICLVPAACHDRLGDPSLQSELDNAPAAERVKDPVVLITLGWIVGIFALVVGLILNGVN